MMVLVRFLLFSLFASGLVLAQEVQITEVQPFSTEGEEWFEFRVYSEDVVDLSAVKISNEKTTKTIGSVRDQLVIFPESALLTGSGYTADSVVVGAGVETFFTWKKSPVSLSNSGGSVQILDGLNNLLSKLTYPKGKSGTRKDYKYSEVFNWDALKSRVYPLIFRDSGNASFAHTKGFSNKASPSFPEDVRVVISEVSPDRDTDKGGDFIEFYIVEGPEKINLKYAEIKHNGTTLHYFTDDFWVSPKQFITLWMGSGLYGITKNTAPYEIHSNAKTGLSAGSGTVELILFSDTSYEATEDFVCYKNETLSKTEQSRVDKNEENWKSACVEISDLIPNESLARQDLESDSDTEMDFFRHFNGSPNTGNVVQNEDPVASITVQGTGRVTHSEPFSVNLTGENSTDGNGKSDIKAYLWTLDGVPFSTEENPKSFRIEALGEYVVVLVVTDFSGATDESSQVFSLLPTGGATSGGSEVGNKAFIENILGAKKTGKEKSSSDDFFTDFLASVSDNFWDELVEPTKQVSSFDIVGDSSQVSEVAEVSRKAQWIEKNIGWAFAGDSLDGLD